MNTQKLTLRWYASEVEKAAPDEGSTATRWSVRDSESLKRVTQRTSQVRETWYLFKRHWSKQTKDTSKDCSPILGEDRSHLVVTEGNYLEAKSAYKVCKETLVTGDNWQWWTSSRCFKTTRLVTYWEHSQTRTSYREKYHSVVSLCFPCEKLPRVPAAYWRSIPCFLMLIWCRQPTEWFLDERLFR